MPDEEYIISIESLREKLKNADTETIRKCLMLYGHLAVSIALFRNAVVEKLKLPKTKGYPPGIFISYRWEGAEHKEWVLKLANYLKGNGFKVFLDQYEVDLRPESFHEVPNFISSIAYCHFFLIVLSPGYLDRVLGRKGQRSWVKDEYEQAIYLLDADKLSIRAVIAKGTERLRFCNEFNTIDLSDYRTDFYEVDQLFPPNQYLTLTDEENKQLIDILIEVDLLLEKRLFWIANKKLQQQNSFRGFFEFKFRKIKCFYGLGEIERALEIGLEIIQEPDIDVPFLFEIIEIVNGCGAHKIALKKLIEIRKSLKQNSSFGVKTSPAEERSNINGSYLNLGPNSKYISHVCICHFMMGNVLEDLASYEAAIHHYIYSFSLLSEKDIVDKSTILNNIGICYNNLGEFEKAKKYLLQSIHANEHNMLPYENLMLTFRATSKKSAFSGLILRMIRKFPHHKEEIESRGKALIEVSFGKKTENSTLKAQFAHYACSNCHAFFSLNARNQNICGDCGTINKFYERRCNSCENTGRVPLLMLDDSSVSDGRILCPICLDGLIKKQ